MESRREMMKCQIRTKAYKTGSRERKEVLEQWRKAPQPELWRTEDSEHPEPQPACYGVTAQRIHSLLLAPEPALY